MYVLEFQESYKALCCARVGKKEKNVIFLEPSHRCSIATHLQQQDGENTTSLAPGIYVCKHMPYSDAIHVYGDPIGPLYLLTHHQEAILNCE